MSQLQGPGPWPHLHPNGFLYFQPLQGLVDLFHLEESCGKTIHIWMLEKPWKKSIKSMLNPTPGFEMTYIFVASRPTTSHNSMFPHWAPRASPENLGSPTDRVPELSSSNDKKICRSFSMVSSEICREPNSGRNGAMITPEVLNLI